MKQERFVDTIQSRAQSAASAPWVTPTNIQRCRHICAASSTNSPLTALRRNMAATAIAAQKWERSTTPHSPLPDCFYLKYHRCVCLDSRRDLFNDVDKQAWSIYNNNKGYLYSTYQNKCSKVLYEIRSRRRNQMVWIKMWILAAKAASFMVSKGTGASCFQPQDRSKCK